MSDCEWMYGDCATGALGVSALAGLNPLRWSGSRTVLKAVEELQKAKNEKDRPIIVKVPSGVMSKAVTLPTIDEAIKYLEENDPVRIQAAKAEAAATKARENAEAAAAEAARAENEEAKKRATEAFVAAKSAAEADIAAAKAHAVEQAEFQAEAKKEHESSTKAFKAVEAEKVKSDLTVKWMFGDAGKVALGFSFAKLNPLRWSGVLDFDTALKELTAAKEKSGDHPIYLLAPANQAEGHRCENIKEAMNHLYTVCPSHKQWKEKYDAATQSMDEAASRLGTHESHLHEANEKVKAAEERLAVMEESFANAVNGADKGSSGGYNQ
jgi:hypothetical protein